MKRGLKAATLALAAIMAGGTLGALVGCGGGGDDKKDNGEDPIAIGDPTGAKDELTVSIFCNASDAATNQKICDDWAKDYNKKNGTNIRVTLKNNTDKSNYFDVLTNEWSTGSTADVIYLAPKYVRAYAERGNILNLAQYLGALEDTDGNNLAELTKDVWQNGISYYGYIRGQRDDYRMGRPITYADGKFVTADGEDAGTAVGLYGLPKDYSNFSTGYNRIFFSPELINAYTTMKATTPRNVKAPEGEGSDEWTSKLTYTGENDGDCIVYAVNNQYGKKGQPANIINPGIPTTYRPYNFFKYESFNDAVAKGDPIAVMASEEEFNGYTVTIPGFPNDELAVGQTTYDATFGPNGVDFSAISVPYNKEIAHVTYTYAEYGALIWACTYYLNTFAWDNGQNGTSGYGGRYVPDAGGKKANGYMTVYGGEQYEGIAGATGSVLYLLPWLAANDADLINDYSTATSQRINDKTMPSFTGADWRKSAGTKSYKATKRTIADTLEERDIQWGHDSENFIETYAAFLAIGSDWNGNPKGDTASTDRPNGWAYFRAGRSLFYGAGSWDAATRNDVHRDVLDFGQMPTPISEKYALYSKVKGANYEEEIYSNDPATAKAGTAAEAKQRENKSDGLREYTANEILANQLRRQDKWAARMDTVGYAVAAKVVNYNSDHAWKKDAAIQLVARLTVNGAAQKDLLYAGAQLPNFKTQCKNFVFYKDVYDTYSNEDKVGFADMLTPDEGFVDTPDGQGEAVWNYYYDIALDMEEQARANSSKTVKDYMATKKDYDGVSPIRYDHAFDDVPFSSFTGTSATSFLGYAMKVLNMVAYRAYDRDINIRMQYGMNAVRDSSMYTYKDGWMGSIDARDDKQHMLAYRMPTEFSTDVKANFLKGNWICYNPSATGTYAFWTPAVWCFQRAVRAQELLLESLQDEYDIWESN